MKKMTKYIILLSIIILMLVIYVGWYFKLMYKNNKIVFSKEEKQEIKEPKNNKEENVKNKEATISVSLGKIINVPLNNEESKDFYLLKEDDLTYTLLAKDSLGATPYYLDKEKFNINTLIQEKTSNWSNVGEVRLPTYEEVNNLKEYDNNEFLFNNSFWVNLPSEKGNNNGYYLNKDTKDLEEDKLYNSHELIVVITILKSLIS